MITPDKLKELGERLKKADAEINEIFSELFENNVQVHVDINTRDELPYAVRPIYINTHITIPYDFRNEK